MQELTLSCLNSPLKTREMVLLACCSRTVVSPSMASYIRQLATEALDWHALLQRAAYHGVMPLLCKNLNEICPTLIPKDIQLQLSLVFRRITFTNLSRTAELLKVLAILNQHQIPVITFKGPTLAELAYGGLALRSFNDLDLLVHCDNYYKPRDILAAYGYQTANYFLTPEQEKRAADYTGEYSLFHADNGVVLDIHARLVSINAFQLGCDFAWIWDNLQPVTLSNQTLQSLSVEDLLLYLCTHATREVWLHLKAICDIAELVQHQPNIDWAQLTETAQNQGLWRILLLGLSLAHEVLGAELPEEILQAATVDPAVRSLRQQVYESLEKVYIDAESIPFLDRFKFHLTVMEQPRDRMRYCFRRLTLPLELFQRISRKEFEFFQLPRSLYFLYPLIRPFRVAHEYGFNALRHIFY
jgi:Uncharacterised nucleotidyltransferase